MFWYRFCSVTYKSTYISFFEKLLGNYYRLKTLNTVKYGVLRLINFDESKKVSSFDSINLKLK